MVRTELIANHPSNDETVSNLLQMKKDELKKVVDENGLECEDKRKSALLRKSIRESYAEIELASVALQIDLDGVKQIWSQLEKYFPVYALFQSDRTNRDQDSEIQDPMKIAIQAILKKEDLQQKLTEVAEEVTTIVEEIANTTLEKLKEMNPEIADQLKPSMPSIDSLKWDSVFKGIGLTSDDDIPMNKRGSGVRRLVLLNFFRAEAERRRSERNVPNIIYAIEEPETSQHPNHQIKLINALIELSQSESTQIILTTHSPALAQLIPSESLRFIERDKREVVYTESDLIRIAKALGVLPNFGKVVVCVEGEFDRQFLLNINQNIDDLKEVIDLVDQDISIIPLLGGNLKSWVEREYLKDSNLIEFHLYDKDDDNKYAEQIAAVNARDDLSCGVLTRCREMENYIHWDLINDHFSISQSNGNWNEIDVPTMIVQASPLNEKAVKQILNGLLAKRMSRELLEDLGVYEEVQGWFETIADLQRRGLSE